MSQPNERTKLLDTHQYIFESSLNSIRQKRLKQFQCCLCAIFLTIILIVLIITIMYSINHENANNSTNISEANNTDTLPPEFIVLTTIWPISDVNVKNETLDDVNDWKNAINAGKERLLEKLNMEGMIPSLKLESPSFRHQKAVATSEIARNLSKIGTLEGYSTEHFYSVCRKHTGRINKVCHKRYKSSPEYCQTQIQCNLFQRFRSYNGTCNNLKNPSTFGVAFRPFRRALPPDYADGISQPKISKIGRLPSARTVSITVHPPFFRHDTKFTVMLAVWGQFLDHDITATALSQKHNGSTISCCTHNNITHPECFPVILDPDDLFQQYNVDCIEFVRSAPAPTCCLGPREQMNQATAFIDGSVIYGTNEDTVRKLRDLNNGTMRVFLTKDGRSLLPPSDDLNDGCNREDEKNKGRYCFMAGDARSNENLHLTTMHLLWVRHHNNLAYNLSALNPQWNDERIFQEARRIIAAQMQHITYNEFLPILLGNKTMTKSGLNLQCKDYARIYNESIDPSMANNFATAAFRFAHSIIPSLMKFLSSQTSSPEYIQMHKMLFNPFKLYDQGELDRTLRGVLNTSIEASDSYFTDELKSHMFERENGINLSKTCGLDLVALNIQRGRDHGLPSYPYWREHCGFSKPTNFSDLENDFDPKSLENIKTIYSTVEDIDLYTGALSEKPIKRGILGPTFTCLILDQFYRIKYGDRFWYETDQHPQAFTPEQLDQIRKTTLANIICETSDNLDVIQPKVMERLSLTNYYVPCSSTEGINLKYWKENLHMLKLTKENVMSDIKEFV